MGSIKKMFRASTAPVSTLVRNLTKHSEPAKMPPVLGKNIFGTFDASKPHRRIRKV